MIEVVEKKPGPSNGNYPLTPAAGAGGGDVEDLTDEHLEAGWSLEHLAHLWM